MHQVQEHTEIKSNWDILVEVWRCEKWQRKEAEEARELGEGTEGPARYPHPSHAHSKSRVD